MSVRFPTPDGGRARSALGRLEGNPSGSEPACQRTGSRQGQRVLGQRRKSATGPIRRGLHYNNPGSEHWATSLRETSDPHSGRMSYEFYAEGSRNNPHPSEDFLRWRVPDKTRGSQLMKDALRRHTKERFYTDYCRTDVSGDGDAYNEVLTKIQDLPYDPNDYVEAARREVLHNPPLPPQYIFHQYVMKGRPASRHETSVVDRDDYTYYDSAEENEEHMYSYARDTSDDNARPPSQLQQKRSVEVKAKPIADKKSIMKKVQVVTSRPPTPEYIRRPASCVHEVLVDPPSAFQPTGSRPSTPAARTQQERTKVKSSHGNGNKQQRRHKHWVVLAETKNGQRTGKAASITGPGVKHAHHGSTFNACVNCDHCRQREFDGLYRKFTEHAPVAHQDLVQTLPHNREAERPRYTQVKVHDLAENRSSSFLHTRPRHRSHFTISNEWTSENVKQPPFVPVLEPVA